MNRVFRVFRVFFGGFGGFWCFFPGLLGVSRGSGGLGRPARELGNQQEHHGRGHLEPQGLGLKTRETSAKWV